MTDGARPLSADRVPPLQAIVTGLLLLAVAYRQGLVTFDIPPTRGELLALIAIALWLAAGAAWFRQGLRGDGFPEWAAGGCLVGLLLAPHVPQLALAVGGGCGVLAALQLAIRRPSTLQFAGNLAARRADLLLGALAVASFRIGGVWDWIGLALLVGSAVLVAWQMGRHLWRWAEGRAPVR
jgi:hypothetical protein